MWQRLALVAGAAGAGSGFLNGFICLKPKKIANATIPPLLGLSSDVVV
jgi:hypothetical protein